MSGWSPAPAGFAPSIDWQMQQTADFADIRQVQHHLLTNYSCKKNISYIVGAPWLFLSQAQRHSEQH